MKSNKRQTLRDRVAAGEDGEAVRLELGMTKQVATEALRHYKGPENRTPDRQALKLPDTTEADLLAREQTSAAALAVLVNRPELKYLRRLERLAWLAQQVAEDGDLKAMELLMKACGDFKPETSVVVNNTPPATLIVIDNGRLRTDDD